MTFFHVFQHVFRVNGLKRMDALEVFGVKTEQYKKTKEITFNNGMGCSNLKTKTPNKPPFIVYALSLPHHLSCVPSMRECTAQARNKGQLADGRQETAHLTVPNYGPIASLICLKTPSELQQFDIFVF